MSFFYRWAIGLTLIGLFAFIRFQTIGLNCDKIHFETHFSLPSFSTKESPPSLLNQSFYFLGKGSQSYAFIGQDQKTVLKLLKHYQGTWSNSLLRFLPFSEGKLLLKKREKRICDIFSSFILAHTKLPSQTGSLYLNLSPSTENLFPTSVIIYDQSRIRHQINLNHVPFMLQKRGEMMFTDYLETHPEEIESKIETLLHLMHDRLKMNIVHRDPSFHKNFMISAQGDVLEIDVGSFEYRKEVNIRDQLYYEVSRLRPWLLSYAPEKIEYLDRKIKEMCSN